MPNIAAVLKSEIGRVARKEIRGELLTLQKAHATAKRDLAQLRKRTDSLERQLKRITREVGRSQPAAEPVAGESQVRRRFSATRLAAHRKQLGLSAAAYAQLVGVSPLTIYKWESGTTRPRDSQLEAIAAVRGMGKREAAAKLEELAS